MTAIYGDPWGRDEALLREMKADWMEALRGCTDGELYEAGRRWIRDQDRWPKPSQILHMILDERPKRVKTYRSEPYTKPTPTALDRMNRMSEIRKRHAASASSTPFSDTINDPAYQVILDEYTRETGRQPA